MKRIPRALDPVERRVLGTLLEKQRLVPDAYPLSVHALVEACNQTSNREPVMRLAEGEVQAALDRLLPDVLVWRTDGARVRKWKHNTERRWRVDAPGQAILTLLLLRGPQTPGELRSRSGRLHDFPSLAAVHEALAALAAGAEPLARELPRQAGQKESRWTDLLSGEPAAREPADGRAAGAGRTGETGEGRLAALEERLSAVERRLAELERALGGAP